MLGYTTHWARGALGVEKKKQQGGKMARTKTPLRLYVVEEQEMYRGLYRDALASTVFKQAVDLLGVSSNGDGAVLRKAVSDQSPDVLLMGTRRLDEDVVAELQHVRGDNPGIGLVILLTSYDTESISMLRSVVQRGSGGIAIFLRQSLDRFEHLLGIVLAASQGQVILDPALAKSLFVEGTEYRFLRELTTRESEVLSLLARGYTNGAIAESLCIDVKTVEHHINALYGKMKAEADFDRRHPRVSTVILYLEAIGELRRCEGSDESSIALCAQ